MQPKLTIGMAHHTDFHGVYFTLQALRLYHSEAMRHCEVLIVDNSAGTSHSQQVGGIANGALGGRNYNPNNQTWVEPPDTDRHQAGLRDRGLVDCRVVHMEGKVGTSATRQHIFNEARAPAVLVMDCHVLLPPGTLQRLLDHYDTDEPRQDIYSGPLLYDTLRGYAEHQLALARGHADEDDQRAWAAIQNAPPRDVSTHFDDVWRGQMWGTWGKAWRCRCGPDGVQMAVVQKSNDGDDVVEFRTLETQVPITSCHHCGQALPENLAWPMHQQALLEGGFYPLGERDTDEPFHIPGCGLGVFTCRADAWLGFNEHARGFGGEELYIHEKYRQAGRHATCLPWLKWLHRFGRPDGVPYPLALWDKVRNYVLEFEELGEPLDPIHEHFVLQGPMNQAHWEHLTDDPIEHIQAPPEEKKGGCGGCKKAKQLNQADSLDAMYALLCTIPRDLDKHLPQLRELAGKCDHITEVSRRRESFITLLSARPARVVSFLYEFDRTAQRAQAYAASEGMDVSVHEKIKGAGVVLEDSTDMLFLNDQPRAAPMREMLARNAHQVNRFIVVAHTQTHGDVGNDGGPGILHALRDFMRDNPTWSVINHTDEQGGLTVMGRQDQDKPKLPKATTIAGNLGKALLGFVSDGGSQVQPDELEARLLVCSTCPQRRNTRCAVCGCYVAQKAKLAGQDCPLGYWPNLDEREAK